MTVLPDSLPIIDFGRFLAGDASEKKRCSLEIMDAFKRYGFLYLTNTSISSSVVQNTFSASAKFFDLPLSDKLELAWKTPEANRGYAAQGREKVSNYEKDFIDRLREKSPDLKESLDIGKEPCKLYQNEWPRALPSLRPTMMDFFYVREKNCSVNLSYNRDF
jgi:isopenicillin N synthase-like dioxygenase